MGIDTDCVSYISSIYGNKDDNICDMECTMWQVVLVVLAGVCKAIVDKISFHYYTSIFRNLRHRFWCPSESWKNKWMGGIKDNGERFLFSSTILVWVTDAWHLFQKLEYSFLFLAIVFYRPMINMVIDFMLLYCVFTLVFEIFFRWVLSKK